MNLIRVIKNFNRSVILADRNAGLRPFGDLVTWSLGD